MVWAEGQFKVGMEVDMVRMSACATPELAREVANKPSFKEVAERLQHYFAVGVNGASVCGNLGGFRATIVSTHGSYRVEGETVTVFGFTPVGTNRVFFGITTLPFESV